MRNILVDALLIFYVATAAYHLQLETRLNLQRHQAKTYQAGNEP